MNSASKKVKTEDEFDILRQHILDCSSISKDSKAIQAALQGLEQERKRMERDTKLQATFARTNQLKQPVIIKPPTHSLPNDNGVPLMTPVAPADDHDDELMEEWLNVSKIEVDQPAEDSSLGMQLAQQAISDMTTAQCTIATPLATVTLALHAALRSTTLQFACTGIPDMGPVSGFAPPIHELPKTMFVPNLWDANDSEIVLRYRKHGVGAVLLQVTLDEQSIVQVQLVLTKSKEPSMITLEFPISDHVNMDSLSVAIRKEKRVLPALHFKSLAVLMTNFCNTFDLGTINEKESSTNETPLWDRYLPQVDRTVHPPDSLRIPVSHPIVPIYCDRKQYESPTIQVFCREPNRGDFSGDLVPTGTTHFAPSGGNLMGPGHPLFNGPASTSGFGMRPRFDPFGPPGGPQDPTVFQDPSLPRPPPGGLGIPNNDIARPPNHLSNNMFM